MIKLMFLAIFAALVLLHVDVDGGLVKPEKAYDCYWKISNASDRVCRNHNQDGFFFLNVYTCSVTMQIWQHGTATASRNNVRGKLVSRVGPGYRYSVGMVRRVRNLRT
uniref:Putative secreted protein n=1 Tax=Ixodes ricinus TaxID=34613 RepID=V5H9Q6_IXORI